MQIPAHSGRTILSSTTVAIIGGTGLYQLEGVELQRTLELDTPFGKPSSPIVCASLGELNLLFLARHGIGHTILPSEINYAANIYALKQLGAQWCLSISAVGSLCEENRPGDIVLPTQYIDRTKSRAHTLYGNGVVVHVPFADPVCPTTHSILSKGCKKVSAGTDRRIADTGTYLCMEGPLFSTRAESNMYRSMGASIIGMTALPEAKFAREAEISYATVATVTDYDCWRSENSDIDIPALLATMDSNVGFVKEMLHEVLPEFAEAKQPENIANVLATSIITRPETISDSRKSELETLLGKYLNQ